MKLKYLLNIKLSSIKILLKLYEAMYYHIIILEKKLYEYKKFNNIVLYLFKI